MEQPKPTRKETPLQLKEKVVHPLKGKASGRIEVVVSGGSGEYDFRWKRRWFWLPKPKAQGVATGLKAGAYRVVVTDKKQKKRKAKSRWIKLQEYRPIESIRVVKLVHALKGKKTGSVKAEAKGGSDPSNLVYHWKEPKREKEIGTGPEIRDLKKGQYELTVEDPLTEFRLSQTFEVDEYPPVSLKEPECQHVTPNHPKNGKIRLEVEHGNNDDPHWRFEWEHPQGKKGPEVEGLEKGTYVVRVKDSRTEDVVEKEISLIEYPDPELGNAEILQATTGKNDGRITIVVAQGSGDYEYGNWKKQGVAEWSFPVDKHGRTADQLSPGEYEFTVTDKETGLSATDRVLIESFDPLDWGGAVVARPAYCNEPDGSIQVSLSGGSREFHWQWFRVENEGPKPLEGINDSVANGLPPGQYRVEAFDPGTGRREAMEIKLEERNPLTINEAEMIDATVGLGNGRIRVEVANGTKELEFLWKKQGDSDWTPAGSSGSTIDQLEAGIYELTVKDLLRGCVCSKRIELKEISVEEEQQREQERLKRAFESREELLRRLREQPQEDIPEPITFPESPDAKKVKSLLLNKSTKFTGTVRLGIHRGEEEAASPIARVPTKEEQVVEFWCREIEIEQRGVGKKKVLILESSKPLPLQEVRSPSRDYLEIRLQLAGGDPRIVRLRLPKPADLRWGERFEEKGEIAVQEVQYLKTDE